MSKPASIGRRRFLTSAACMGCAGTYGLFHPLIASAQSTADRTDLVLPSRFSRPALETDEGGLWAMMDREERKLRRSPFVVRDEQLTTYLQGIACRLGGEHCADVRVHVVRTPLFNASMAPNGMLQVWSGLLLRVENEAQLAAVIGHEIGHYLERHSLARLRDARNRAAFGQFVGLFGAVGALAQLGMLAGAFAYTRDHEVQADRLGMHLMLRAGYEGREAASVWSNLLDEVKVRGGEDIGRRSPMMATHPPLESRRDDLLALAGEQTVTGQTGRDAYALMIRPHRMDWLMDEVNRGQYEESLVLFKRLLGSEPSSQVRFARAEVYRNRASSGDLELALADLTAATGDQQPVPQAHRSLGLVYRQMGMLPEARQAFERYLQSVPDAADAALVQSYLSEMNT